MYRLIRFLILMVFIVACGRENSFRLGPVFVAPVIVKGCQSQFATNFEVNAEIENGSCLFNFCEISGYEEFDKELYQQVSKYIQQHGPQFEEKNRIKSTCKNKKFYCSHPDSLNYVPGPYPPAGFHSEYCYFKACDKPKYQGRDKYDEYTEFLKKHPGEIMVDNSVLYCKEKRGCTTQYATNIDPIATVENGECLFSYCPDSGYKEYNDTVHQVVSNYINSWGAQYLGKNRVTNTCKTPNLYCTHPDADNYVAGPYPPKGYHQEYCFFTACNKDKYEGKDKYNEYVEFLKTHAGEIKINNSNGYCMGKRGCTSNLASNRDPQATIENGECLFTYCPDNRYQEFNDLTHQFVLGYINNWGNQYQGKDRVTNSCQTEKIYCEHPDALNYVTGPYPPEGYHHEYCYFIACDKPEFAGYPKYVEFQNFLKSHPGEIQINNAPNYCGDQVIFHTDRSFHPDVIDRDFKNAEISFLIDDSTSMDQEIKDVKNALSDLAETFISLDADIQLSFHLFSKIHTKALWNPGWTLPNGLFRYEYVLPEAEGKVAIKGNSKVGEVQSQIKNILNNVHTTSTFSAEQGLCLTLHHLKETIINKFQPKTRYINVMLTDEDEHFKNNSASCKNTFDKKRHTDPEVPPFLLNLTPYTDQNGQKTHFGSFEKLLNDYLKPEEKAAYGWIGFFYDHNVSSCPTAQQHGETYLQFMQELDRLGIANEYADLCSQDYKQTVYEKLIQSFLDKYVFRYQFFTHPGLVTVNKVEALSQGSIEVIDANQYTYERNGDDHFIFFEDSKENKKVLKEAESIKVYFTYYK